MTAYTTVDSPIGALLLVGEGARLTGLYMEPHRPDPAWIRDDAPFAETAAQLAEYFAGERPSFDLPLAARGTPFQQEVWERLRAIPYGETTTYGAIAAELGRPAAVRAVGMANGRNPISIVVPCHRVIGAGGALTGYGGGLERKRALLALEARVRDGFRATLW